MLREIHQIRQGPVAYEYLTFACSAPYVKSQRPVSDSADDPPIFGDFPTKGPFFRC